MQNSIIFLDGQFKTISQDGFRAFSPGLIRGLGVFETLLCEDGKVFFLAQHYRRFLHGCDRYVLPQPMSLRETKDILGQLLRDNKLRDGRIRMMSWRKGWELHFAMLVVPRSPFPEKVYRRGFSACLYPRRLDRPFQLAKVKSLDYGFFLRAYEYALKNDCHEALLMNSRGQVVEGSRSNIFFVKDHKLFTPSLASGCLAGTTRQTVLTLAKSLNLKIPAASGTSVDLQSSEEAFLTNALVGIMPLTHFLGHRISDGQPGHLTQRLAQGYRKLSQEHADFLI